MVDSWTTDNEYIVQVTAPAETIVQVTGGGSGGGTTELPDGVVLGGVGPPQTEAIGAPVLDGIHDPWRQGGENVSGTFLSSQFYAVSWTEGAVIEASTTIGDGGYNWLAADPNNLTPTWADVVNGSIDASFSGLVTPTAGAAGSGVLGLSFGGDADDLDTDIDPADHFGAGVTIIGPYDFPPGTPSVALPAPDGYYYVDSTHPAAPTLYGPKTAGDWGSGTVVRTTEFITDITFYDNTTGPVLSSPDFSVFRITVADDGTLGTTAV